MNIVSLGTDRNVFEPHSAVAKRLVRYGAGVDRYTVVVPCGKTQHLRLSNTVSAQGVASHGKISAFFALYFFLRKYFDSEKYDVLTVQDPYILGLLGYWFSKIKHMGFEVQVHGTEQNTFLRKYIMKFVLGRAHAVRTVSNRLASELKQFYGVPGKKITVVPIFTSVVEGMHERAEQKIQEIEQGYPFIFLTVSRLVPVKRIIEQIHAVRRLLNEGKNIQLWIVGTGLEEKSLKKYVKNFHIGQSVVFFRWKEKNDLEKLYKQAHCFLFTSKKEGWGLAVVEAASYGLPIIMTNVGCAGELIQNRKSGLVVPIGDLEALASAMREILENDALRQRLQTGAREAVTHLPTLEETLRRYRESWQKAIQL
ncbi:MAG TPA: hypothetical protein DCY48_04680 [Candidatus Magasanikbacteria bacterium]|nr:MAG: hypothetical protein A3I74_03170 [Candidatus Magasanikbacteria bacterium RIFCSPLOWO2_02_FULL_47_16]OGH80212.1 MAG: hypothetical protein A3C10_03450 [Candidatus Magasanikbacteria bacterium RIFCSPHIGHO2_02_FULL_48_18]OGH82705.1 MAG: hypothetical protein A3G08_01465 [Candidatus Magasanikbacteria bacterium RIFCSPLOWO2_12_FULL_47_9b]HAZ29037.1 hypothetical protein [Candidatus Magasanikbacteria bacterium]